MGTSTLVGLDASGTSSGRGTQRGGLVDLLWTLPFLVLFWIQLAHHAMWRDEVNAFGIAASAGTFPHLLSLVRYEGHPWLWYGLLWLVSKVTLDPVGMKVLQAGIGSAIYLMIGVWSPFSRVEKLMLFLSYFVCFEYTVLSRMYGLMLLLALLYVRRRAIKPAGVAGNAALLGALANTDLTGLMLSGALLLEFSYTVWKAKPGTLEGDLKVGDGRRRLAAGAGIYCALVLVSVLSLWPTKDISHGTVGYAFKVWTLANLAGASMNYIDVPYFATMTGRPGKFWNTVSYQHPILFKLALPVVLGLYWLCLRRRGNLVVLLGSAIFFMVLVGDLVYMGSMRNFGTTVVAFIACLWLLRSSGERIPWAGTVLLGLTVLAGVDAEAEQWRRPFSNAKNTATWLQQHGFDRLPWVGSRDTSVIGVAEQAEHPLYQLECNCTERFLLFGQRRDNFEAAEIPARLGLARTNLHAAEMLYIGTAALSGGDESALKAEGFSIQPLKTFEGAESPYEDFYVYDLRSAAVAGSTLPSGLEATTNYSLRYER